MRTTKRFTPTILERFTKQGRGLGTFKNFLPWHRVGRGDPSSRGRSHIQMWNERQRELLSDKEWVGLFFSVLLKNLVDLVEQFPLSLTGSVHELSKYCVGAFQSTHPGTIELAERLEIRHPKITEIGRSSAWVMTTDIILVLKHATGKLELLAVAFKTNEDFANKRTKELLSLEREYWISRGVAWLLITPAQYDKRVEHRLRDTMPWAIADPVPETDILTASVIVTKHQGRSLTYVLQVLTAKFGDDNYAKRAFWQAVWCGKIPLDLRRGWRPHQPLFLLSEDEFNSLNPIASRRSAWI